MEGRLTPSLFPELRWRGRRSIWMPEHQLFRPSEFGVEIIPDDRTARTFVEAHHYSGSYVAAQFRVGLYHKVGVHPNYLAGVAVFSVCVQPKAYAKHLGTEAGIELGRLILLPEVRFNGESWFMARAFSALKRERPEIRGVLSYSDPVPRHTSEGVMVMPGHIGQVYQALNASYLGRSSSRVLHLDSDGRAIAGRGLTKIRKGEKGGPPSYERLVQAGAPEIQEGESRADWVRRALAHFRRVSHPGNHIYVWRWDAKIPSQPFPRSAA